MHRALDLIPSTPQVSCGVHTCGPTETEGSEAPGHPQLHINIEASLDYVGFCPEKQKQTKMWGRDRQETTESHWTAYIS